VGVEEEAKGAARKAQSSPVLEWLARAGFAAVGTIHVLLGALVIALAFGSRSDSTQSGALKVIAGAPAGFVVLWVLAITLWCLATWQVLDGVLARGTSARGWARRVGEWSRALVYLVLGAVAAAVALGSRPNAKKSAQHVSRGLLDLPGGSLLLGAIGAAVAVAGVVFIVIGARRSFCKRLELRGGAMDRVVVVLGVIGYVAKGAALMVVGVAVVVAAVTVDPAAAGGLDAALTGLLAVPFGPVLVVAVGAGFVVYGAYCFFRVRFAAL
jgi:hypothetical protein